jgi:hypothetical protein
MTRKVISKPSDEGQLERRGHMEAQQSELVSWLQLVAKIRYLVKPRVGFAV